MPDPAAETLDNDPANTCRQVGTNQSNKVGHWKLVELVLADHLTASQVHHHAHAQVRIIAAEAGEFVHDVRVELPVVTTGAGHRRWRVTYLPGPPALRIVDGQANSLDDM